MFPGTAVLHYNLVEQRCLFLAWFGVHSATIRILSVWAENSIHHGLRSAKLDTICNLPAWTLSDQAVPVSTKILCWLTATGRPLPICWLTAVGHTCTSLHHIPLSWMYNYGPPLIFITFWCALFYVANMVSFCRNGCFNYNEGGYLVYTWQQERMLYYKVFARGLCFMVLGLPVMTLLFIFVKDPSDVVDVLSALWVAKFEFAAILTGLIPLVRTVGGHAFAYDSQEFKARVFTRSWTALLLQSNNVFAQRLEEAMIKYARGNKGPLQELYRFPSDLMQAAMQKDEDQDEEVEDYDEETEDLDVEESFLLVGTLARELT